MGAKPTGYSASRISSILGLNSYQTQTEIWQVIQEEINPGFNIEKGYILPVFDGNASTRFGLAFESSICSLVENKFKTKIINREKFYSKTFDDITLSAHVDGESKDGTFLTENKTTTTQSFYSIKDDKKNWGLENTDEVPIQYQLQCAVQRICSEYKEVKLNVLVFPESPEKWEEMGWKVDSSEGFNPMSLVFAPNGEFKYRKSTAEWANSLYEMGFLKTFNLPSNPTLENLIIEKIKKFDTDYVKTQLPPKATEYKDVQRLLRMPQGTIIATEELKRLALEYSEATRQLGKSGPLQKRREAIKIEIMNEIMNTQKADWVNPPDKIILVSEDGGIELASFSIKGGFKAKRAK